MNDKELKYNLSGKVIGVLVENSDGSVSQVGLEWIESKKEEWEKEVLLEILECIENPEHPNYSNPKKYIKSLINKYER